MAHSTTAAVPAVTTTTDEINYFYQDENGKILKVLKQVEVKQEQPGRSNRSSASSSSSSCGGQLANATIYTLDSSVTGGTSLNQMNTNQPQFVRIHNNYNLHTTDNSANYSVITTQNNMQQLHNDTSCIDHRGANVSGSSSGSQHQHQVATVSYDPQDSYARTPKTIATKTDSGSYMKYHQQQLAQQKQQQSLLLSKQESPQQHTTKSKIHSSSHQNASVVQRKRKPEKAGKGLRHFSLKVCEKVKMKGSTTYNEVADELVAEEIHNNTFDTTNCDQKNIRRRVYDALNVLMALQIISKDKKEIRWIGLPSNTVEQCSQLEKENEERRERIRQKHQQLRELLLQLVSFKNLIQRNKEAERNGIIPTPNSSIQLPFIIVNTHKSTKINCSVTNDKSEYIFKFEDKFEMHDDAEVLKRMGLLYGLDKGQCSYEDVERAKSLVPPNFEKYIEAYSQGKISADMLLESDDEMSSCDLIELTNDSTSQPGFLNSTSGTAVSGTALSTPTSTRVNSQSLGILGIKAYNLDDDEEYIINSDID